MTSSANHGRLGPIGVWTLDIRAEPDSSELTAETAEAVAELDELGFDTLWIGRSPSIAEVAPVVAAGRRIKVATGILSIWQHDAADVAADVARLEESAPGRFFLGLGVSHEKFTPGYAKPYGAMVAYLDGLDTAPVPVPAERRLLAALGPKMLRLSADRAGGAHPYLVTSGQIAEARELLGPDAVIAPDLKVVLEPDLDRARSIARENLSFYLELPNYLRSFERAGFSAPDFVDGGSDRLLDAVFALGDVDRARRKIEEFRSAGADHVALNVMTGDQGLPRRQWRDLAAALELS
ncbi:TIGR03620 family F420-dependent LLM class oxidoreductase [Streptomyces sp. NPDC020875]|uniref:TIGR03620 family F420-dependent LLM class oxidoreductase n=1 Tax=Streptomyces sp. NPDC020875 TaxID=3154898 RepID=UPI0033C8C3D6